VFIRDLAWPTCKNPEVLLLLEEEIRVDTHSAVTGKVRVSTLVVRANEVSKMALNENRVEVTRLPVGREVDVEPAVRTVGEAVIMPVLDEIMVIESGSSLRRNCLFADWSPRKYSRFRLCSASSAA